MNMMTPISAYQPATTEREKYFLNEKGEPSDRAGPDLTLARPIGDLVRELRRARASFGVQFWRACRASSIHVFVTRDETGEDRLMMGFPVDGQELLRRPRYDALFELAHSTERRRQAVVDLVNVLGHFSDIEPFDTLTDAVAMILAAGCRLMVNSDGELEEGISLSTTQWNEHADAGWSLKRAFQRYRATLQLPGNREALVSLVQEHGAPDDGWFVLGAAEVLNG